MRRLAGTIGLAGVGVAVCALAQPVLAQTSPQAGQTVTVIAGEQYGKPLGGTFFWGKDYRDLWTAPIRVEVLNLRTFAGGLQIARIVGGNESRGLALRGADGREYTFRPVKKDLSGIVPVEFRDSVLVDIIQDQIAATLPMSEEVKGPLARAAGVLTTGSARTVVLPDDDTLGEYRKEFAGQLGVLIEFPQPKSATNPGFHDATEILSATSFWEQRRAGAPNVHPDTRAFLRARLLDLFLGDWDRHKGQWRWARLPGQPLLQPISEDPDMALSDYEGMALTAARFLKAPFTTFDAKYAPLLSTTKNGWDVDRFLLTDIERQEWMAIAKDLQAKLTDGAIEAAIGELPQEYQKLRGAELIAVLKGRRDNLLAYAERFYHYMSTEVDVQGSNAAETATVEWLADGGMQVSVGEQSSAPYYRRRFAREDTNEVRVYLHGGNDRVSVQGQRTGGIKLRVIGGPGDDVVDNASGAGVTLYDSEGQNRAEGRGTRFDDRTFTMTPRPEPNDLEWVPNPDWGGIRSPIVAIGYSTDPGIILGGGFDVMKRGFRKYPYGSHQTFQAAWATGVSKPFLDYQGAFKRTGSNTEWILRARFSGIEQLRFYGFGNETAFVTSLDKLYQIDDYQTEVFPAMGISGSRGYSFAFGPFLQYSSSGGTDPLTVLGQQQPLGFGKFGHAGARFEANWSGRKGKDVFAPGVAVNTTLKQNFAVWDAEDPFGSFAADLEGHATVAPNRLFLMAKAGGKQVWGEYPFFEAAYLGRRTTLGFGWNRFAGDALLYGGAEADLVFKRMRRLVPGDVGMSAFLDVGRVFLDGEDSSKWHPSGGLGLFYAAFQRTTLLGMKIGTNEDRWFVAFEMRLAGLGF